MAGISQAERDRRDALYERGLKVCNTHGEPLPLDSFAPRHDGYKRLNGTCRACHNAATQAHQKRYPERVNGRMKRWREANPERWREITRRYAVRAEWRAQQGSA